MGGKGGGNPKQLILICPTVLFVVLVYSVSLILFAKSAQALNWYPVCKSK